MFNHEPENYNCPFCVVADGQETEYNKSSDIVYNDDTVMAWISPQWWPNNPGNVIVIPTEHIENIYCISDVLWCQINKVAKKFTVAMKESYQCDGISLRHHNEPAGNQDVWHFHLHVLPRWENDDLYINYPNKRWVSSDERLPYAEKLRDHLK